MIEPFILACLRSQWEPAALETARAAVHDAGFAWDEFLAAAQSQSLAPLLYRILRDQGIVPAALEQELRQAYYGTALRNTFLFHRLDEVLRLLAERDIPALVLKGAALSKTVYAGAPVRPMGDLDLLVRSEAVLACLEALKAAGWEESMAEARNGLTLAYEVEVALQKPGPIPTILEIHWGLLDSPYYQRVLPGDWLWETAQPVRFGAQEALILGLEAQLLHLCAHLALHHRGEGLLWQHDIAALIARDGDAVAWPELFARAQAADLVLPLKHSLLRLADDWGVPIPVDVVARLRVLQPSADEARMFALLTAPERPVAQRFYTDLAGMASWRERADYAWSSLFPSPAYMRQRYGVVRTLLLPFYYPYRWLGLAGTLGAATRKVGLRIEIGRLPPAVLYCTMGMRAPYRKSREEGSAQRKLDDDDILQSPPATTPTETSNN